MPKSGNGIKKTLASRRTKFNFIILFIFVATLGIYFWNTVRPKIVFASCSEIAINASQLQARNGFSINSDHLYDEALNECLYKAGVDPQVTETPGTM